MKDPKAFKLNVYKGWTSKEVMDAKIHLYFIDSELQNKFEALEMPDRFNFLNVEKTLKAGLRFSVNLARRTVFRNSRIAICIWTLATIGTLEVCCRLPLLTNGKEDRDDIQKMSIGMIICVLIFLSVSLFERYVMLPRLKAFYALLVHEMESGFRSKGWQLEFHTSNWSSPTGAAAFFKLTSIPVCHNDVDAIESMASLPLPPNAAKHDDDDVWICASELDQNGWHWCCCGSGLPSVLDGVPSTMRPSVNIFLWGCLVEACVKARVDHNLNRQCQRQKLKMVNLCLLMVFGIPVAWISQHVQHPTLKRTLIAAVVLLCVIVSWGIAAKSTANAAKEFFHPKMRKITTEFASKFEQAGYRVAYVTEDGMLPYRKRSMLLPVFKSGKSFFRFEPMRHGVKMLETGSRSGWLV